MTKHNVFVYGTLKDKERQDEYFISGSLYNLGPFPGIKLTGDKKVPGQLLVVTDEELARLDIYEAVPDLYKRLEVTVETHAGDAMTAWIYEYNGDVSSKSQIDKW